MSGQPLQVVSGDAVPDFKVQALDMWRNPCGAWAGMATTITAECLQLDPPSQEFEVDAAGEATITGTLPESQPMLETPSARSNLNYLGRALCRHGHGEGKRSLNVDVDACHMLGEAMVLKQGLTPPEVPADVLLCMLSD